MAATNHHPRRRGMQAIAAMEFRVGLYLWLTRVLPAFRAGWLWVSCSVTCICGIPLIAAAWAAAASGPPRAAGWVAIAFSVPGRMLLLAGIAGLFVWSDGLSGWPSPRGVPEGMKRGHVARLLPVSLVEREGAGALGRLASMAALVVPGMALMALGWLVAWSGGEQRPELREATMWGLATLPILVLSRTERAFVPVHWGVSGTPGLIYLLFWWARARGIPDPQHLSVWQPAAWIALLWIALLGLQLGGSLVGAAVRAASGPLPLCPTTLVGRWRGGRWGANWARACTPEAGVREWLRAMMVVLAQVLLVGGACVVLWPIAAVCLGHRASADLAARACFIALPALGAGLSVAASTGGMIESRPEGTRELLPLRPPGRWRALLLAGVVDSCVFAALGEALGAAGLVVARAVSGAPATAPVAMYWLPLIIPAAALIAWGHEPLTRYPFRLIPGGETLWCVLLVAVALVVVPIALAVVDVEGAWTLVSAIALWPAAALVVLASRLTTDPATWAVEADGTVPPGVSQKAHAILLLSAASLGLAADCLFLALMAAVVR